MSTDEEFGRVAVISGADGGIGAAVAQELMNHGYRLSLGALDPKSLEKLHGPETENRMYARFDAFEPETAEKWIITTATRFGGIDILINCAGWAEPVSIYDDNDEALNRLWTVNAKAPLRLTRLCLPYLEETGRGRITNLVSMAGKRVRNAFVGYAMTKYALMAVTHSTRTLTWDKGVRATAVCPGWVSTEMSKNAKTKTIELDEMISPETLAHIIRINLELPNSAAIAELLVNCEFEDIF
ncbi:SDR family NAD(P)-dependent oxidoreductase [Jannaschia marina]|uniref:SDR family NAD(P)-dependent oxidoreductase n=1 Tax=Jannaschia marina TaxID=2741674 RepID=UPI0015CEEAAC|nr:SDR family NAD(P)-dependent oxidoreductase [Jannaschia marina]